MNTYPVYLRALLLIALLSASNKAPATPSNTNLPTIELSADATRSAANDLVRATVAAEASGATLGDVSKQVNTQINEALKTAKSYSSVKTQSSNTKARTQTIQNREKSNPGGCVPSFPLNRGRYHCPIRTTWKTANRSQAAFCYHFISNAEECRE